MKVYLDCCCYCRLLDNLSQERIVLERNAIIKVFDLHKRGIISLAGSEVLSNEIGRIRDDHKRNKLLARFSSVDEVVEFNDSIDLRSFQIQEQSTIHAFDSYHIASAEEAGADIMLTTDDRLIKRASRLELNVKVMNPKDFIDKYWNGGVFDGKSKLQ